MKAAPDLNNSRLALREKLCVECAQREATDIPAPPAPAKCESDCPLFLNLPRLARVATEGEPPCGYDVFVKSFLASTAAGHTPDVVQALTILQVAATAPHDVCTETGGCVRLARIATALACLRDGTTEGSEGNG